MKTSFQEITMMIKSFANISGMIPKSANYEYYSILYRDPEIDKLLLREQKLTTDFQKLLAAGTNTIGDMHSLLNESTKYKE